MIVSRLEDAAGKTPGGHFDMRTFSLIEKKPGSDENLACSVSCYLPGGGAEFGTQPVEVMFYVLEGEMTIETDNGDITLPAGDMIHISKGENKGVKNNTNRPASMLVIANVPADFPGARPPGK